MNRKDFPVNVKVLALVVMTAIGLFGFSRWMVQTQALAETRPLYQPASTLKVRYLFSGVSDDGEQGSASRKEATSIHCTNVSASDNDVEVDVYQWDGIDVFTGTVTMPPNRTFTFSTQNTTIYFDDVILGGVPGTDAIFQGSGRILSASDEVICSAQVLDPLNYPPIFATKLTMYFADGTVVGDSRELYLPIIVRP